MMLTKMQVNKMITSKAAPPHWFIVGGGVGGVWWGLGHTVVGWHSSGVGVHQADWLICAIHKTYKTFGEAGKFIPEALGKAMETYLKISEVAQYS